MIVTSQTPPTACSVRKTSATTPADFAIAVLESPPSVAYVYLTAEDVRVVLPALARILAEHDARVLEEEMAADAQRMALRDEELDGGEQTEPDYA